MVEFVPHPSRSQLGFTEAVKRAFEFLQRDHGFALTRVDEPTRVRFERKKVVLDVVHGRGDYVVTAEIGRRLPFGFGHDVVTIYEVFGSLGVLDEMEGGWVAETGEEVSDRVGRLARAVATVAGPWLRGEGRAFRMAKRFRSRPSVQPQRRTHSSDGLIGNARGDDLGSADSEDDDPPRQLGGSGDPEPSRLAAPTGQTHAPILTGSSLTRDERFSDHR